MDSGAAKLESVVRLCHLRHYEALQVYLTEVRIGDERHVMTYCIAGGQSFNMVLSHPDRGDPSFPGSEDEILEKMRNEFQGWDPQ